MTDRLAFVSAERSLNLKLCPCHCAGTPGVWLFGHRLCSAALLTLLGELDPGTFLTFTLNPSLV